MGDWEPRSGRQPSIPDEDWAKVDHPWIRHVERALGNLHGGLQSVKEQGEDNHSLLTALLARIKKGSSVDELTALDFEAVRADATAAKRWASKALTTTQKTNLGSRRFAAMVQNRIDELERIIRAGDKERSDEARKELADLKRVASDRAHGWVRYIVAVVVSVLLGIIAYQYVRGGGH